MHPFVCNVRMQRNAIEWNAMERSNQSIVSIKTLINKESIKPNTSQIQTRCKPKTFGTDVVSCLVFRIFTKQNVRKGAA